MGIPPTPSSEEGNKHTMLPSSINNEKNKRVNLHFARLSESVFSIM